MKYETTALPYQIPATVHKYTPDFTKGKVHIEVKGRLTVYDRRKMLLVKEQHPNHRFIFVFSKPGNKLYKGSKTTYVDWCEANGFEWIDVKHLTKERVHGWLKGSAIT